MRWLKRIALTLLAVALVFVAGIGFVVYQASAPYHQLAGSWVFKPPVRPVIGDLGGMLVSISQKVARFVEYEDDPHFLEPRKNPHPVRTYQSKLRSFGFEVRFPDMAMLDNPEAAKEKRQSNIYNTMWLGVGVDVKSYHDDLSLNRLVDGITPPEKIWSVERMSPDIPASTWKEEHGYMRLPEPLYGLVVMEVTGFDDSKRYKIPGNSMLDKNIYYHSNPNEKVDSYIECSNIKHAAAPCEQKFALSTVKNTMVKVHYRIGFLPQWHEIQEAATKVILGFAVDSKQIENKPIVKPQTQSGN